MTSAQRREQSRPVQGVRFPGGAAFLFPLLLAAVLAAVPRDSSAEPVDNDTCLSCHGQEGMGAPLVDAGTFQKSIHGANLCVSCHRDAGELPHAGKLAEVSCAGCHRVESQIYLNSDHGRAVSRGRKEAASCKDCHGHSHTLLNSRDPVSPVNRRNIAATCARCHADDARMADVRLAERHPMESYEHTVHGQAFKAGKINSAVCSDCHGTHDLHGSFNPASRVYKNNIPLTCGRCHQNVESVYRESIHGQALKAGIKETPVCTDCHGEHTIQSPKDASSSVWTGAVTKTCAGCHESERLVLKLGLPADRLKSYLDTYHGMAAQRGDLRVANCASCHGFHDVLPSSDPRASINKANVANTCGRCHPGAGRRIAGGFVHGPPSGKHWALAFVKSFYAFLIPLVLGFMLLHNGLDWLRKSWSGRRDTSHVTHDAANAVRLTVNERWQHAVLAATFVLLAYSGFALKFQDAGWAQLLAPFTETTRRSIHRWAALVFTLLAVYHALYLAAARRGRQVLREMWPRPRDAAAFFRKLAYLAGLRRTLPAEDAYYDYAEKIEYWSLVWGSVVMVVTGAVLVFNDFTLKHFPLWLSDLANLVHYYEAVLACLAILIWHFYGIMFDPAVYPMNWAWLLGRRRKEEGHEGPGKKD
jgi:formate dehydrogenase gamma subunit